jgi:ketosteroid isomerase-like protein
MASAKEVVDRALQAWRARDANALAQCYADDAVVAASGGMEARGPEGARMFFTAWTEAFPDNEVTIDREYIAGSVVVQEGTFSGTHTGNWVAPDGTVIPPTGRRLSGPYVDIVVVEDGLIASDRLYHDRLDVLEQLGLMPEPATGS